MPIVVPARNAANRISVMRGHKLVPLMPGADRGARIKQPWNGILLERHAVNAIEIPVHEHRDICLHLQIEGDSDMEWWSDGGNQIEQTAPGSMILLDAGTRDRLRWEGDSKRLIVSLQPQLFQKTAEELGARQAPTLRNRWSFRDPALANLLREMADQAAGDWPLGHLYADLLGMGLSATLLRRYAEEPPPAAELTGHLPLPKLRRAMEFMTENLYRDVHLEEIAQQAGLSAFHFAREFRATAGQTPYQYLLDQRIERAKTLLRTRTNAVQEIALETGFSSATNFARAFRQRVGVTPKAWQQGQ